MPATTSAALPTQAATDSITLLTSRGVNLTKTWTATGTISPAAAKYHTLESQVVTNIHDLRDVLASLASRPQTYAIRGQFKGFDAASVKADPDAKGKFILRRLSYFADVPRHWAMFDVDTFIPSMGTAAPEVAIDEWIRLSLPPEFQGISYAWHLSSSHGHPSKPKDAIRFHLWFWFEQAVDSATLVAWATQKRVPVDRAVFQAVQAHYTADPIIETGDDPIPNRSGFVDGFFGDAVALDLSGVDATLIEQARRDTSRADGFVDPREKHGVIGAVCRAYSVPELLQAEWFEQAGDFVPVTDSRWTWLAGRGMGEGLIVDDLGLVNTHDSAPRDTIRRRLNAFDVLRIYQFGHLDDEADDVTKDMAESNPTLWPSYTATRQFCLQLPKVVAEMEDFDASKSLDAEVSGQVPVPADSDTRKKCAAERYGVDMLDAIKFVLGEQGATEAEIEGMVLTPNIVASWRGCFYNPTNSKLFFLAKDDSLVQFIYADWERMLRATFGPMLDKDKVSEAASRIEGGDPDDTQDRVESLEKACWSVFSKYVKLYKQRSSVSFRVDMFDGQGYVRMTPDTAEVTHKFLPFRQKPTGLSEAVEAAILAEYKEHMGFLDDLLDLLLHARFASDRRKAFLWWRMPSSGGKGFAIQGVLGKDGLGIMCEVQAKEIEAALEGKPVGISIEEIKRAWGIAMDEFKSAKGEFKLLNSSFRAAPKNQLRFEVELFTKLFTSAEGVDSLAGSEGVEPQFAERFSLIDSTERGAGRLDDQPQFRAVGKTLYRQVVTNYAATRLNSGVAHFRQLGRVAAANIADAWLDQWHITHGIGQQEGLLDDSLAGYADEIRKIITDYAKMLVGDLSEDRSYLDRIASPIRAQLASSVAMVRGSRHKTRSTHAGLEWLAHVKRPVALVKVWINAVIDQSQRATVGHKSKAIADILAGGNANKTIKYYAVGKDDQIEQVVGKGLLLDLGIPAHCPGLADNVLEFKAR